MSDVIVEEQLWASSSLPEGTLERWFAADGAWVVQGDRIAEIRVEDCLHEVIAPESGRLSILSKPNAIIEPGSRIAVLAE